MRPSAWRPRHDAFAEAVRALRRASPQGPQPAALHSLERALRIHLRYEEDELWPLYAPEASDDGPSSMRALHRDHRSIETQLARCHEEDPLRRAVALERLEGVLEHHDAREARYVLPALDRLEVRIGLDEPEIAHASLAPIPTAPEAHGTWPVLLAALARDREIVPPAIPDHPKGPRLHAQLVRALTARAQATDLTSRREAAVEAFDRLLRIVWISEPSAAPST